MGEINYNTEKCWNIPSGKNQIPATVTGNRITFLSGTISYDDYEALGRAIDHDRCYLPDGRRVYDVASIRDLPEQIDGQIVLHGQSASSYDYKNGKCEILFRDKNECCEHARRLAERGLITISAPDDSLAPTPV